MTNPELTLVQRFRPPLHATVRPPLLILLHGVGSNENDLFGLAPKLDPRFAIVSARQTRARLEATPGLTWRSRRMDR